MSNRLLRVLLTLWVLGLAGVPTLAQSQRTIEVKVTDVQDQPIADAKVMVRSVSYRFSADEAGFGDAASGLPNKQVATDAMGVAKIDVTDLLGDDLDAPVSVATWKVGYGMQSTSVQNSFEFKLSPLRKRTIQVVDAEDKPLKGLRVEHAVEESLAASRSVMQWWTEEYSVTDEFGLVTLESPSTGVLSLAIQEAGGTSHRVHLSDANRLNGRWIDLRDVSVVRLSPHGQVEGKMSPEFVKDYRVRLMKDYRATLARNFELWSSLSDQVSVNEDGSFRVDAVAEGSYWVIVYRDEPYESSASMNLTELPVSIQKIEVSAGTVSTIQIKTEPSAKVTGRVVGGDAQADYTGLRLVFNRAIPDESNSRILEGHNVARSVCSADGTFTCWLPAGRFRVTPIATANWKLNGLLEFEVGRGAATITTADISMIPTKEVKVQWLREERGPYTLLSYIDNRISFVTGESDRSDCSLTADGYGRVRLPVGAEVQSITREILSSRGVEPSSFVDRDPSENFDLELVKTPQGMSSNVALRGRAIDAHGQGVRGVPISVSLSYEPIASTNTVSREGGSQLLDVAWSTADGSYKIPARQLVRRMTVPGREISSEGRFTFTISTPANPNPIEVEKVYTVKPSEWDMLDIELPDLVIDRPLGGQHLKGKLLDAQGQPSDGERVRLAEKRHVIRTLTDREGQFAIEDLAGPVWLLREGDWSIHAVSDYTQPITLAFKSSPEPPADARPAKGWQRADQKLRQTLAKELLKTIPNGQGMFRIAQNLSDDFYLEPEKFFRQLLLARGQGSDEARLRFVNFWSHLSDQQLQELADSMEQAPSKVQIMRLIADRHPSAAAYSKVMDAIVPPKNLEENSVYIERMLDHLAAVGLKLHHYGVLDTTKISEFLALRAAESSRVARNPRAAIQGRPESESIAMCRALLDPLQFAADVGETAPVESSELNTELRVQEARNREILLRLFPADFEKINRLRGLASEQTLIDLSEQAPLEALAAVKQGKVPVEFLRVIAAVALNSGRAEAARVFEESARELLRVDQSRFRPSALSIGARNLDLNWYKAARRTSVEFRKMVAWHLAHDYLSGKYDDASVSILSIRDRNYQQMLTTAYCLSEDYPELAMQIAQRAVPRMLRSAEQELDQSYSRASDISLAAWFEPQAATELVMKISKQLDEEKKQQGAKPDARLFSKTNRLMSLRDSCLRGLLLDEF